ncbi:MAG: radical SAM protein [Oscillospiraceae bacterium]|nr:radical SAM protein [Oscillospiraceae bacterium]
MKAKKQILPFFIPNNGCNHACVFCNQNKISGAQKSATSKDVIDAAGSFFTTDYPAEIAFYGGSFTGIPVEVQNELLGAAYSFVNGHKDRSIRISTRPDLIDGSIIDRLIGYGVDTIELGAQSMCDDVLLLSKRGHNASHVDIAAKLIKKAGLTLVLQMMTGLPGDSIEKSIFTAKRFIEMEADAVRIYPTVVVANTQLHDMWQNGAYREHTIEDAIEYCVELCELFIEARVPILRLGLNPTESLTAGDAVAGAYHPALGELVYSRMYRKKVTALLESLPKGENATIFVPLGARSKMVGQHRSNINYLKEYFSLKSIKVIETTMEFDDIFIEIA